MSSIGIVIYSYKGKIIKDVITNIMHHSSGKNKIKIYLAEQHPLIKDEYFKDKEYVDYNHIFWDHPYGSCIKKFELIQKVSEEYVFVLGDNVLLNKNWDETLLRFIDSKNIIVSGMGKLRLSQDKLFYFTKEYSSSTEFIMSNFVDSNFIFAHKNIFNNTDYPTFLKYNGEDEYLSLFWYTSGIDIYSCPSDVGQILGKNSLETLYVPYSINHNYNEVIEVIKGGFSKNIKIENKRSIQDFLLFHAIDLTKIHKLPFQTNDVEYDCYQTKFDDLDGRKFLGRTNAIY